MHPHKGAAVLPIKTVKGKQLFIFHLAPKNTWYISEIVKKNKIQKKMQPASHVQYTSVNQVVAKKTTGTMVDVCVAPQRRSLLSTTEIQWLAKNAKCAITYLVPPLSYHMPPSRYFSGLIRVLITVIYLRDLLRCRSCWPGGMCLHDTAAPYALTCLPLVGYL